MNDRLHYADEVRAARRSGTPLVAPESTLISHGLPHPENIEVAEAAEAAVRDAGAAPAARARSSLSCGAIALSLTRS